MGKESELDVLTPAEIRAKLGSLPWMTLEQGEIITGFIHEHKLKQVLELGFCHGVSTCYLAAAVARFEGGAVVTIDKQKVRKYQPNIQQLLERLGLASLVTVHYEPASYIWRLVKMLEEDPRPRFDLCYIDGGHQLAQDGIAFFLADRLLRPGGWVIFDDLYWTVASNLNWEKTSWAVKLTEEERNTPQIRKLYELLVKTHPHYDRFRVEEGWAFAHKKEDSERPAEVRIETIVKPMPMTREMFLQLLRDKKQKDLMGH